MLKSNAYIARTSAGSGCGVPSAVACHRLSRAIGCRGEATCRVLWSRIPLAYKAGRCFAEIWDAYARVVPQEQLQQSHKRGPTNHLERFNGTLRQRMGRLTPQTASFSKSDLMHCITIHLFIHHYNTPKGSP